MEETIKVVVRKQSRNVQVQVPEPSASDSEGVAKLRGELGNIDTDLSLLFNIGMDL